MKFELPQLPYAIGDLEPHLSAKPLEFHYDRHHRGYLEKLRGLIEGTPHGTIEMADLVTWRFADENLQTFTTKGS